MSFLKQLSALKVGGARSQSLNLQTSLSINVNQIRTATKKVSGSKTNKNDSAGRRLGPKVHEGNFVKTGQIIMRQRGTKIHPGENVDIGNDHTIFASEPGYVRFYYNPFHPLRKYVGVALRKDLTLPTPHFEPRVRRFGYVELTNPIEAQREENQMSRAEYLQQPNLKKLTSERQEKDQALYTEYSENLSKFSLELDESNSKLAGERLLNITQLVSAGQPIEEARIQATYNYVYDLKLALRRGSISETEFTESKAKYLELINEVDSKVTIDADYKLCKFISQADKEIKQDEIIKTLKEQYTNKVINKEDKSQIVNLITTPGIYTKAEQNELKETYLPKVLPTSIEGTVVDVKNPSKPPKGVTVSRIFNETERKIDIVGRTKEAFIN